ncbi:tRNA pseudouridine synthase C [Gallaecimonas xiamenensis 3-C-1]|uniref:tRNA pseudouridine synthase C n=2 Tax=Gallaecimonas TaxID=745410 RepID=K2JFW2_9GAMM|nr:tRNA pseudouridine synthase C [Gallaecimonas xiamenensis 3-C-1]
MMLPICYQDEHLVVIDKPAGLLVHRSKIASGERRFAMQMLRDQLGQHVFPAHRLDRPTSGLLLFALSSDVARQLTTLFTDRAVKKSYLSLVRGWVKEGGLLDYPLVEEHDAVMGQPRLEKSAQDAVTAYAPLAHGELPFAVGRYNTARYSLMACSPKTGRRHQLRRHFDHLRHPIINDTTHGDGKHNKFFREQMAFNELGLRAWRLSFTHPVTGQALDIRAPLPDSWQALFTQFGWNGQALMADADSWHDKEY